MQKQRLVITGILFLWLGFSLYGQTEALQDLKKVSENYSGNKEFFRMDISYKIYDKSQKSNGQKKYSGFFMGNSQTYYVKHQDKEIVKNREGTIFMVDHSRNLIVVQKNSPSRLENSKLFMVDMEKLKSFIDKADSLKRNENKDRIEYIFDLQNSNLPFQEITCHINKDNFHVMYYKFCYKQSYSRMYNFTSGGSAVMEIRYKDQRFVKASKYKHKVSYKRFLSHYDGETARPLEKYSQYRVEIL